MGMFKAAADAGVEAAKASLMDRMGAGLSGLKDKAIALKERHFPRSPEQLELPFPKAPGLMDRAGASVRGALSGLDDRIQGHVDSGMYGLAERLDPHLSSPALRNGAASILEHLRSHPYAYGAGALGAAGLGGYGLYRALSNDSASEEAPAL